MDLELDNYEFSTSRLLLNRRETHRIIAFVKGSSSPDRLLRYANYRYSERRDLAALSIATAVQCISIKLRGVVWKCVVCAIEGNGR